MASLQRHACGSIPDSRFPIPASDLDRGLPERIAGAVYGVVLGILFGAPLGWFLALRGPWLVLFIILAAWAMGTALKRMTTAVIDGAGKGGQGRYRGRPGRLRRRHAPPSNRSRTPLPRGRSALP